MTTPHSVLDSTDTLSRFVTGCL